jgi:energy-coupling factor transport system permease protein
MSRGEKSGAKRLRSSDYACQFLVHDSPIHRLRAPWKVVFGTVLSACAVGARTPLELILLVAVTLCYFFAARLTLYDLWRDTKVLVLQGVVVIAAYCLKHGVAEGLWPGVRTSAQIIVFYLPGAVFLRTTRSKEVMQGMSRFIPYRLSFLLFVSIRFVPFFLREMEEIAAAQRLRGARLLPREQLDPRNWGDLFHCLLVPLMVRALKTADEVSRSAEAREFGSRRERTYLGKLSEAEGAPLAAGIATPKLSQEA